MEHAPREHVVDALGRERHLQDVPLHEVAALPERPDALAGDVDGGRQIHPDPLDVAREMRDVERREVRAPAADLEHDAAPGEEVVELGHRAQSPADDLVALDEPQVALGLVGVLLLPLVAEALLRLRLVVGRDEARDPAAYRVGATVVAGESAGDRLVGACGLDQADAFVAGGIDEERERRSPHAVSATLVWTGTLRRSARPRPHRGPARARERSQATAGTARWRSRSRRARGCAASRR